MLELLGLVAGACFAGCGIPTMFKTIKLGKSIGTPIDIAWLIFIGGITMYTYLYLKFGFDWVLAFNYTIEIISWGVIVKYHYFPTTFEVTLKENDALSSNN